jgi:hypothetical protein
MSTFAYVIALHSTQVCAAIAFHVSPCSGLPSTKAGFLLLASWKEVRTFDMSLATPAAGPISPDLRPDNPLDRSLQGATEECRFFVEESDSVCCSR